MVLIFILSRTCFLRFDKVNNLFNDDNITYFNRTFEHLNKKRIYLLRTIICLKEE